MESREADAQDLPSDAQQVAVNVVAFHSQDERCNEQLPAGEPQEADVDSMALAQGSVAQQAQAEPNMVVPTQQGDGQTQEMPPLSLSLTRPPSDLPPGLREDFQADFALGEGAYACVQRLRHRVTGDVVALKIVEKYPLLIRNMMPQLQREVNIQRALLHRHILRLLTWVEDESYLYMVLEFCAGGSLRTLALRLPDQRFAELDTARYFAQICDGIDFMHRSSCVHRDLKVENVLLTHDNEVRICDFGWSAEVQAERILLTTCGTPTYWPPEVFAGLPQGPPVDLWSLGNLVYEMLVGHPPFWGSMDEIRMKVLAVDLRYPPGLLSNDAVSLFYCLLQRDPYMRIPCHRLLNEHPWVQHGATVFMQELVTRQAVCPDAPGVPVAVEVPADTVLCTSSMVEVVAESQSVVVNGEVRSAAVEAPATVGRDVSAEEPGDLVCPVRQPSEEREDGLKLPATTDDPHGETGV